MPLLQKLSERLEGLQAEEAVRMANAVAVGSGTMKQDDRDEVVGSWRRAINRHQKRVRQSNDQIAAAAAAAGLTVVRS